MSYPRWLQSTEAELVADRRRAALGGAEGVAPRASAANEQVPSARVGLALSGGGIRSATFALGVLQALARAGALKAVDYLSSVSGGGYTGAFWGGLFVQEPRRAAPAPPSAAAESPAELVEQCLAGDCSSESPQVAWLRRNSRYLIPDASSGLVLLAIYLRNWLSVLLNLCVAATGLFVAAYGLQVAASALPLALPAHAVLVSGLWLSPYLLLPAALALVAGVPLGLSYWLVADGRHRRGVLPPALFVPVLWAVLLGWLALSLDLNLTASPPAALLGYVRLAAWVLCGQLLVALICVAYARRKLAGEVLRMRHWLTVALKNVVALCLAGCLFAAYDSLGQTLYAHLVLGWQQLWGWLAGVAAALAAVASFGARFSTWLTQCRPSGKAWAPPLSFLLLLGGLAVASFWLVIAATTAHALLWQGALPSGLALGERGVRCQDVRCADAVQPLWWGGLMLALAVTVWLQSQLRTFLNQSSLSMFYAARLTRTFLGASNPQRLELQSLACAGAASEPNAAPAKQRDSALEADANDATEPIAGDEIAMRDYAPHRVGGPLHIINCTLNETVDARTSSQRMQRQELSFALGPCALSVGVDHHAARYPSEHPARLELQSRQDDERDADGAFRLFPRRTHADALSLGKWVSISGAAVAPGLGAQSSLGAGLLTVLFNLRLGHWWHSGTDPYAIEVQNRTQSSKSFARWGRWFARHFSVLSHLLDELLVRFYGTARRNWYLTDGGHFENTGCYELLRRRLELIVCCDATADPDYTFEDIGKLVRRARIDFGAEITFLQSEQLAQVLHPEIAPLFAPLTQLTRRTPGTGDSPARAALAQVRYSDQSCGLLLVLKPRLCGAEPRDLTQYASAAHEAFPHESTLDQLFDEAQWESYRKLGEITAAQVFDAVRDARPSQFFPGVLASGPAATAQNIARALSALQGPQASAAAPKAPVTSEQRELSRGAQTG